MADSTPPDLAAQKQDVLLAFHQVCWDEMTWRRNAGYRTVILGLGYCGVIGISHPTQDLAHGRTCSSVAGVACGFRHRSG